jgi:two-component system, NtrC family, nitrogen regulation sensor histidine kinase NtrY
MSGRTGCHNARARRGGSVSVDWQLSEAEVVLSISDEGAGIANPDNQFVPFFSTKKGGSGARTAARGP